DLLVEGYERNGRLAGQIAVGKCRNYGAFEAVLVVQDVVRDAKLLSHPPGIMNVLAGTAAPRAGRCRAVVIELQSYADDVVAVAFQESCHHRGIHAAGHGNDDTPPRAMRRVLACLF